MSMVLTHLSTEHHQASVSSSYAKELGYSQTTISIELLDFYISCAHRIDTATDEKTAAIDTRELPEK